ncbi:MAG: type II secretion system protein, partial [Enterococcus faecalis]|nr:type II secretion system protein [Enterococcus faecalis]
MTKQLFNAYCMMFLFLKLLRNFRWGVANIRRKLTIYSGFILLESLVSFSIV